MIVNRVMKSIASLVRGAPLKRTGSVTVSALMVIATMLVGVQTASADLVQHQSYQRGSQTEVCAPQVGETPWQPEWGTDSSWKPSWELWANEGAGGWVCSRSIVWAKSSDDSSGVRCSIGDIGPGDGLVFMVSDGLCYEMAPKTWSGGSEDPTTSWCSDSGNNVSTSRAIGAGRTNTTAMLTAAAPFSGCTSGAANEAVAYNGGGFTDWFLPSYDEMNAMCNYSRNPSSPLPPSETCAGSVYPGRFQTDAFAASAYGFTVSRTSTTNYWNSSQWDNPRYSYSQGFGTGGYMGYGGKWNSLSVRPIRAY